MAPLQLEGDTLGQKQKHFNILVDKQLAEGSATTKKINPDGTDLENLLSIEIACKTKNLEVILDALKSEDMLYVSRAIKHSSWLVTDPQYAHIINPEYLHAQLFPHMTVKACNKLLLHIRLNLKDEARVDEYYHFLKNKHQVAALKWLPHCSLDVIEKEVEERYSDIDTHLLKRLCEKSITVLQIYVQKCQDNNVDYKPNVLKSVMFLINDHTEKYLECYEKMEYFCDKPNFGPKATSVIMTKCPKRIMDNFVKYCEYIHLPTFAKKLNSEDIKGFLLKFTENEEMKKEYTNWFSCFNLINFKRWVPEQGRFEFFQTIFMASHEKFRKDPVALSCQIGETPSIFASKYRWYKLAPFETAFRDLKKRIGSESSPKERNAMLKVILFCANRNQEYNDQLLQYYHDRHINEPFKFKLKFVDMFITQTSTWIYNEKTWNNLHNIFQSMEIYIESEKDVQTCIYCVIVKKVINNENVPSIIENKFKLNLNMKTLRSVLKHLTPEEKHKVLNYVINVTMQKINDVAIQNGAKFTEVVELLEQLLTLMLDYNKDLANFPDVVAKIKELAHLKEKNSWNADMDRLYNKMKGWRRYIFEESLVVCPGEGACLNALKHEPELLRRHAGAVAALRRDDAVSLRRVLAKLRVYWHGSLAAEWAGEYLAQLEGQGGHKAIVRGLCTLLPLKQLLDIIKKYEPVDNKINWSEDDEILLSLRKQIAKNMHIARPAPPLDAVLPYARGDYMQFALPSLNSILHNISLTECSKNIPKLLKASKSLQKIVIRTALPKIHSAELQNLSDVWNSSEVSVRDLLVKETCKLLRNEKDPSRIDEIWKVLETFIEKLSHDKNRLKHDLLSQVNDIPLQVRPNYLMKSYAYLESVSPKPISELASKFLSCARDIIDYLEPTFVINILQKSPQKEMLQDSEESEVYLSVMSAFLLCAKDGKTQIVRYEQVLAPMLDRCLDQWEKREGRTYVVQKNVSVLLKHLCEDIPQYVFEKKMAFPGQLFACIQGKLKAKLPMLENWLFLKTWEITVEFVRILELENAQMQSNSAEANFSNSKTRFGRWDGVYLKAAPAFATYIVEHLKEEMKQQRIPLVYHLLGRALRNLRTVNYLTWEFKMGLNNNVMYEIFRNILENKNLPECYLLVIEAMPDILCAEQYYDDDDETREKLENIKQMIRAHPSVEVKMNYYSDIIIDI